MKKKKKKINLNWKEKLLMPKRLFCISIPFDNKNDFKKALKHIQSTRNKIQSGGLNPSENKWYCDGLLIDRNDYWKLLQKSKSIEILNEIEED